MSGHEVNSAAALKFFELRDKGTFIPLFAFRAYGHGDTIANKWLALRAGFGTDSPCVIMGRLEAAGTDRNCSYDPFSWGGRTFPVAHQYIEEHFEELVSGAVIDVEFILGETPSPKQSEKEDPL